MPSAGPELDLGEGRGSESPLPGGGRPEAGHGLPPIKGFLETSFIDWPGLISSVVFFAGL